ncbi:arginine biosynthesis bifunctional protein ArgJ [Xylaria bambusicola]|uniref:arginine biosynthesis bifunctional protein ArgJ n=1 Tax=Xylaria bambusicola TaxID=326684 RepID=UPI0020074401|nr:arginine biosynthesis bifunctional protein ArgJ [Xylaria bambusicola]KAI0525373.1 arginine biosynthesis bifunctional protein ArgJ [Xylaria bambusicola]
MLSKVFKSSWQKDVAKATSRAATIYKPPKGFKVSGTIVGVKPNNTTKLDLAFITSQSPCSAAAVVTKTKFQAAPITVSRKLLESHGSNIRGVIINSGNANAVTGSGGLEDALAMSKTADQYLGAENSALVMSTGVIGQRLPIKRILDGIPAAHEALGDSEMHWMECATAICTTDTFPKLRFRTFTLPSSPSIEYRIAGMTKGAGMICPNMATLLGVVATDAPIATPALQAALRAATDKSFNSISIDNDMSTNDIVAVLANGAAGGSEVTAEKKEDFETFKAVLTDLSVDLAKLIVQDGEGATKFITIRVTDALSEAGARQIAATVAQSSLFKTAMYGKDANWGRIVASAGSAFVRPGQAQVDDAPDIDVDRMCVSLVPADGSAELKLLVDGRPEVVDESRAASILQNENVEFVISLGTGSHEATHWTCDLSHEYVTINGDYRT